VDGGRYFLKRLSPATDWVMRVTGDHVHRILILKTGVMDLTQRRLTLRGHRTKLLVRGHEMLPVGGHQCVSLVLQQHKLVDRGRYELWRAVALLRLSPPRGAPSG
jgi:hypothetical protein